MQKCHPFKCPANDAWGKVCPFFFRRFCPDYNHSLPLLGFFQMCNTHIFFKKLRRYHTMQTDSKLAESKLKSAEGAQQKLQAPRKKASVKRSKNADKLREKVSVTGHDSTGFLRRSSTSNFFRTKRRDR